MLRRMKAVFDTHKIVMTRPLYKAEAYLMLYPEGYGYLMDVVVKHADFFGEDFLLRFESAWGKIHSDQGRRELYAMLAGITSPEGRRKDLVEDRGEARAAVAVLSIYSAFLVSFFEGGYRKAFDLLYAAETIHQDAKVHARNAEVSQWAADEVGSA